MRRFLALLVLILAPPALAQTTFTVTTAADAGAGSLRQAILDANANPGADMIAFNIPGAGPHTIQVQSALPTVIGPVVIDGYTQPGASPNTNPAGALNAVLRVELDGDDLPGGISGLTITAGGSTVRGLVINRCGGDGIRLAVGGGNVIEGNFIGTDVTGAEARSNGGSGVRAINSPDNRIGGATAAARNLISGNDFHGVDLGGSGSTGNRIEGNLIGPNAAATAGLGGIFGVFLPDANDNVIGGTAPGAGNVISGNGNTGLVIRSASGNRVEGNYIGTDPAGTAPLPNGGAGVLIEDDATGNVIGGAVPAARNVISGNEDEGVGVEDGAAQNRIQGNYIGTDATGSAALGNGADGILVEDAAGTVIGGAEAGQGNVIAANGDDGIDLDGDGTTGTLMQGNRIGTDAAGVLDLGNADVGIRLGGGASGSTVGGTGEGAGNVVAFSGSAGIALFSGTGNALLGNAVHANGALGIDLAGDGLTPNDPGDADEGPNRLQNVPEVASATGDDAATLTVTYTVPTATASATYPLRVEFFLADADDQEGRTFIGSDTYEAAEAGQPANAVFAPASPVLDADRVVATATDADGNTSEFGAAVTVVGGTVANESGAEEPSALTLHAAPNPASGFTTLALDVPQAGRVAVAVYDLLGRRVAVLHDGPLAAGSHALHFETANLPGGVYVVRASGASGRVSRQVTLVR